MSLISRLYSFGWDSAKPFHSTVDPPEAFQTRKAADDASTEAWKGHGEAREDQTPLEGCKARAQLALGLP